MNKNLLLFILSFLFVQCISQTDNIKGEMDLKEQIIQKYVYDCANKINYLINMKEYQECLNSALEKDSTIAYLWQQKAMPYFKIKKYEVGMQYLNQAVNYDRKRYLPYKPEFDYNKSYLDKKQLNEIAKSVLPN